MDKQTMDSWNIFAKTGNIQDYLNYKQLENQLSISEKGTEFRQNSSQDPIQEFH